MLSGHDRLHFNLIPFDTGRSVFLSSQQQHRILRHWFQIRPSTTTLTRLFDLPQILEAGKMCSSRTVAGENSLDVGRRPREGRSTTHNQTRGADGFFIMQLEPCETQSSDILRGVECNQGKRSTGAIGVLSSMQSPVDEQCEQVMM